MIEQLPLLMLFVAATAGTPGPANSLFLASGAAFGWRATMPFLLGTLVGFAATGAAIGAGISAILIQNQEMRAALTIASGAYVLYLAWRIATADPKAVQAEKRFSFLQGLIVHPLNPKAWAMLTAASIQFSGAAGTQAGQIVLIISTFVVLGGALNVLWAMGGELMTARIKDIGRLRVINRVMGALLALVVLGLALPQLGAHDPARRIAEAPAAPIAL